MKPAVSVIIPVYNSEKYLHQCVDSALNQTERNIEVILIDDGSTDSSPVICDEYAANDERVLVIHQKNQRIGAARNAGINACSGEYITFLDSDDTLELDTYSVALKYFEDPDVDMVEWDMTFVREENYSGLDENSPVSELVEMSLSNWETMKYMFSRHNGDRRFNNIGLITHCVWTKIFRRELLGDDLRFPVGKEYEDEIIVHRIMERANKIVTINKRCSNYRLHNSSTIHTMPISGRFNKLEAYEDRFRMILDHNDDELKSLAARDYMTSIINMYLLAHDEKNRKYKKKTLEKASILKNNVKYLSKTDRLIFRAFLLSPEFSIYFYQLYRKRRG